MIGLGRGIYHKPKFILLDECTNAISIDLEMEIYHYLQNIGVTIITLSERESMLKYHDYVLQLQEKGSWKFYRVSHSES